MLTPMWKKRSRRSTSDGSPTAPLSRRKRIVFRLATAALSLVVLALVEFGLRLFTSYGGYPPVFTPILKVDDGASVVSTNQAGVRPFFVRNKDRRGTFWTTEFLDPKPEGTVRVLLVGGSAIKGFPQTRAFAVSAFLREMLQDAWPGREVEIINLGTTAVASFPALTIMTEALEYEPDLVVVYSGHNEFFGAFGVASLNTVAQSPRMIALQFGLRRLAIVQSMDELLASWAGETDGERPLMEVMMASAYTGPRDPLRDAAARNLRTHVRAMIDRCNRADVPIVVCTLPSNERGLAPLGSPRLDHLNAVDARRVRETLERASAQVKSDPPSAAEALRRVLGEAPDHARAHWLLAAALHASGDFDEAADHYRKSVDLDPMPWRATKSQNDAIRAAGRDDGAVLCDVQRVFRDHSEGGSVGWELMDDHVHMSLRGQALAARAVVGALVEMDEPLRVDPARFESLPDWEEYASRLGDNPFERYAVAYRMRPMFDIPFFKDANAQASEANDWRLRDIESRMSQAERQGVRRWEDPEVNIGFSRPLSSVIGEIAMRQGRFDDAAGLFKVTMNSVSKYTNQSLEYTYLHCRAQQMSRGWINEETDALAHRALARGRLMIDNSSQPEYMLHRHCGAILRMLGEHAEAIPHLMNARAGCSDQMLVAIDQAIVHSCLERGEFDRALSLADWGIANAGNAAPSYKAMRAHVLSERDGASSDDGAVPGALDGPS